jgi:hypothetical protein
MPDHYSGHDPARGCGCLVVAFLALGAWGVVVLAIIGAIEVARRVLG